MSVSFYNIFQPFARKGEKEKGDTGGRRELNAIRKKEGEKQDKGKDRKFNATTDKGKENLMLQQTGGERI